MAPGNLLPALAPAPNVAVPRLRIATSVNTPRQARQTARSQSFQSSASTPKPSPSGLADLSVRLRPFTAALAAVVPLILPLPASADDHSGLLQVASPWLAVTLGALAFAAAAPDRHFYTTRKPAAVSKGPRNTDTQAPYEPAVTGKEPTNLTFAVAQSLPETEAFVEPFKDKPDGVDERSNAPKPELSLAIATVEGAGQEHENEKTRLSDLSFGSVETTFEPDNLLEWTGLDAGEKAAGWEGLLPVNGASFNLFSIDEPKEDAGAPKGEAAHSAVAPAAEPHKTTMDPLTKLVSAQIASEASQMQKEYNEKLATLKFAQGKLASWNSTADVNASRVQATALQKSYDTKLASLKETAVKKEQDAASRWQAHLNVVDRIRSSAQALREQQEGAKPNLGLVKLTAPALGLARMNPKAVLASLVETFMALWNWLKGSAKRITGQKPGTQLQY